MQHLNATRPKHIRGKVRFGSLLAALPLKCLLSENSQNPLSCIGFFLYPELCRFNPGLAETSEFSLILSEGNLYDAVVWQFFCAKPEGWRSEILCELSESLVKGSVWCAMWVSHGLTRMNRPRLTSICELWYKYCTWDGLNNCFILKNESGWLIRLHLRVCGCVCICRSHGWCCH